MGGHNANREPCNALRPWSTTRSPSESNRRRGDALATTVAVVVVFVVSAIFLLGFAVGVGHAFPDDCEEHPAVCGG